jgi:hypothetical protein
MASLKVWFKEERGIDRFRSFKVSTVVCMCWGLLQE